MLILSVTAENVSRAPNPNKLSTDYRDLKIRREEQVSKLNCYIIRSHAKLRVRLYKTKAYSCLNWCFSRTNLTVAMNASRAKILTRHRSMYWYCTMNLYSSYSYLFISTS